MKELYLEVTYRGGKPIAAYFYLPRGATDRCFITAQPSPGLVVDFTRRGKPIGIEITAPGKVTVPAINKVLKDLGLPPITRADIAPLRKRSAA